MAENSLTDVDWRMLQCVSQGISNKDITKALCKSEYTIRNQLSALYKQINVTNRAHAAFWYRDHLPEKSGPTGVDFVDRRKGKVEDRRRAVDDGQPSAFNASLLIK